MADTKQHEHEHEAAPPAAEAAAPTARSNHRQQHRPHHKPQQKAPMPAGRARKLKQPRAGDMPRVLAELLHEPKLALLHRVVRIVGPKAAWGLLKQTLRVEQQGGQQVNALGSGAPDKFLVVADAATQEKAPRQRTPGGIFFTLLRDAVSRETYREIYEVENKKKKDFKKRVRYQKKQKFERVVAQLGFDVLHIDQHAAAADGGEQPAAAAVPRYAPSADDVEEGEVEDMELM